MTGPLYHQEMRGKKMNPLTALPDLLGKLGSEHFSAEVQGKHIALLKEQFGILSRENTQLSSEVSALKTEIGVLQSEKEHLAKENKILKSKIQEYEQTGQTSHDDLLRTSKMKWGCLVFQGDGKLYCPSCFHKTGKKVETLRRNTNFRFCAVCKTDLPSG
jgi:regulator of replication initiation timing